MADIQTITVDNEKLNYLIGLIACNSCPLLKSCGRGFSSSECEKKIKRWVKPTREYHIRAKMTCEEEVWVEAATEEEALEEARERFEDDFIFSDIELKIEDD